MKKIIKIRDGYYNPAKDIFQVHDIPDSILNERQTNTLVNLNVFDKWCYVVVESPFRVGDWVQCIDVPTYVFETRDGVNRQGAGWQMNKVFKVDRTTLENNVLWEAGNPRGVFANFVRKLSEEEIQEYINVFWHDEEEPDLPF